MKNNEIERDILTVLGIEMLEHENENYLAGDYATRSEKKQRLLTDALDKLRILMHRHRELETLVEDGEGLRREIAAANKRITELEASNKALCDACSKRDLRVETRNEDEHREACAMRTAIYDMTVNLEAEGFTSADQDNITRIKAEVRQAIAEVEKGWKEIAAASRALTLQGILPALGTLAERVDAMHQRDQDVNCRLISDRDALIESHRKETSEKLRWIAQDGKHQRILAEIARRLGAGYKIDEWDGLPDAVTHLIESKTSTGTLDTTSETEEKPAAFCIGFFS